MKRLALLLLSISVFSFLAGRGTSIIVLLGILVGIAYQIIYYSKLFKETGISSNDNTNSDEDSNHKDLTNQSSNKFNINSLYNNHQDSDYQFLRNIVQHIGIGIITFKKDGAVQIVNSATKRLLRISQIQNISELNSTSMELTEAFKTLKTGGHQLLRLRIREETVHLSLYAIELTLREEEIKLISMTNIQSELEAKEMEAWQNLVHVLTHEIMNSVTPISSLAGTVDEDLKKQLENSNFTLSKDQIEDIHLSLQTISRRSDGLIEFVNKFRNLTVVPKPKISEIALKPLLEDIAKLHKRELFDNQISITTLVNPPQLSILADKSLIEQILINLIKNSIQSFDSQGDKEIKLSGYTKNNGRPVISVSDNGSGIEPEALDKIFIPFFSTKKAGSGIGLSLSREIMRAHGGRILVQSKLDNGTEFQLHF